MMFGLILFSPPSRPYTGRNPKVLLVKNTSRAYAIYLLTTYGTKVTDDNGFDNLLTVVASISVDLNSLDDTSWSCALATTSALPYHDEGELFPVSFNSQAYDLAVVYDDLLLLVELRHTKCWFGMVSYYAVFDELRST
jgi:hypothetical protein